MDIDYQTIIGYILDIYAHAGAGPGSTAVDAAVCGALAARGWRLVDDIAIDPDGRGWSLETGDRVDAESARWRAVDSTAGWRVESDDGWADILIGPRREATILAQALTDAETRPDDDETIDATIDAARWLATQTIWHAPSADWSDGVYGVDGAGVADDGARYVLPPEDIGRAWIVLTLVAGEDAYGNRIIRVLADGSLASVVAALRSD